MIYINTTGEGKFEQRKGAQESWGAWGAVVIGRGLNEKVMLQLELEGGERIGREPMWGKSIQVGEHPDRGHECECAQHVQVQPGGPGCRSGGRKGQLKFLSRVQRGAL